VSGPLSRLLRWLAGGKPLLEITWSVQADRAALLYPDVLPCSTCGNAYQARPWERTAPEWRCRACAEKAEQVAA